MKMSKKVLIRGCLSLKLAIISLRVIFDQKGSIPVFYHWLMVKNSKFVMEDYKSIIEPRSDKLLKE